MLDEELVTVGIAARLRWDKLSAMEQIISNAPYHGQDLLRAGYIIKWRTFPLEFSFA